MDFSPSSSSLASIKKNDFPTISLCPKSETGVLNFLTKNPEYDGRGIVMAIFDSGVDPGAPGLQVTTTGEHKVIERYDCSGAGDVDTSHIAKVTADGFITTLSGRKLKVPENWKNDSGEYHIGTKPLYELYTSKVRERIEKKRKEANWDPQYRMTVADLTKKLSGEQIVTKSSDNLSPLEKWAREDIEAQIDVLTSQDKKYKDLGLLIDCIVFHTGTEWKACLSLHDQPLENSLLLGEFKTTHDFGPLIKEDQMNLSMNIWEDGNRLEIVGMSGSHGTHVSSIAGAYFPENPDLNGVAPGAQIISYTIGDKRLDTMETGAALVRAMCHIMQNSERIHVINMSYGEHAHWSATSRIGELMKELLDKYNVSWVASAGNHGPAISTVGTPPWVTSNTLIGVGAYVSPEMMTAEYSLREKLPGMPYTWSSRGPAPDGDIGVSVCAPGGAITSVPNFTLSGAQLMNGTSMAAPHVCGCIALILSAAKAKGIAWSPFSVKKALETSAQFLPHVEPIAQGSGLIQVEPAFNALEVLSKTKERDVRFNVSINSGTGLGSAWPMKGIYIRDPPLEKPKEYAVTVNPVFFKEESVDPQAKIDFRINLVLLSDASWVHVPKYFDLANVQRSFNVKINPEGLPVGVHYAKIEAFDVDDTKKGPVFSIFVTVVRPETLPCVPYCRPTFEIAQTTFVPGQIRRYYLQVPKGATWAMLNMKLEGPGGASLPVSALGTARFVIHSMTLLPLQCCKSEEFYKIVSLQPMEESNLSFKVMEGRVLELVVSRWWAEPPETVALKINLSFRSAYLNRPEITMNSGDAYQKLIVANSFSTEEVSPSAVLKYQVSLLRPTDMKIVPLSSPRDMIPDGRIIYGLQATYNFSLLKATEITVNCALLSDTLYEGEYEAQLWMLFDCNKRYLTSGDAYPSKWSCKLEKGDYTLLLQVRHEKREALEKFMTPSGNNGNSSVTWNGDSHVSALPVLLSMKLPSCINLDVYQTQYELQDYKSSKKSSGWTCVLKRDSSVNVFLSSYISDKNLKNLPGASTLYLQGTFTATKDENGKKICSYPLKICIPDSPPKSKNNSNNKDNEKSKTEEMREQLRDLQINWITKFDEEDSQSTYEKLITEYDSHIPLHIARIQALDSQLQSCSMIRCKEGKTSADNSDSGNKNDTSILTEAASFEKVVHLCKETLKICDKVLSLIDPVSLLCTYGARSPQSHQEATKTKRTMDRLVEAMAKKGLILCELYQLKHNFNVDLDCEVSLEDLDALMVELLKFADINDSKVVEFSIAHAMSRNHMGRAAKMLLKQMESDPVKWTVDSDRKLIQVFKKLDWTHLTWLWENNLHIRYSKDYRLF